MKRNPLEQQIHLQYLWQSPFGKKPGERIRNVRLRVPGQAFQFGSPDELFSDLPYRVAHALEQRDPNSVSGVWGISHWRAERMCGNVTQSVYFGPNTDVQESVWEKAKSFRLLCYYRVPTANEAIKLISKTREIRFACEINEDWYDPENGIVPVVSDDARFIASHAIPLLAFDTETKRFSFHHRWGNWGKRGWGELPIENWNKTILDSWDTACRGLFVPNAIESGIVSRGWKWGTDYASGVHCIDIYDADRDEYLAWAFCVLRDGRLDIDEFFVRPEERGRGYARELSSLVKRLANQLKVSVRLVVSFADTVELPTKS